MKNPDDELWNDVFDEGTDPAFARASCARTAQYARRLRRRKKVAGLGVTYGAVCILFYAALHLLVPARISLPVMQPTIRPGQDTRMDPVTIQASADSAAVPIHFLTDEELFSRFPNRPLALIGSPYHHQELVFLDDPRSVRAAMHARAGLALR